MSDKLRELELLKQKLQMQRELPFLYKHKFYPWQREFYESTNKMCFLTAANQIGKSTIMQKKCVNWCTDKSLWKKLWPHKMKDELDLPSPIWYLYPDSKLATAEFHEKWVRELLPSGRMKNHPIYGWEAKFEKRMIQEVRFNSGVTLYFKTYAQNPASLQASTVYAIFCDEELPEHLYDELKFRLSNTDGYFNMAFTATLNQELWRCTMEESGKLEKFPRAFKKQVSLYDCQFYEDGEQSEWTKERIQNKIDGCSSDTEVQRRIFGKFVTEKGKKYPQFDPEKSTMEPRTIPKNWTIYEGMDYGSGGKKGHPSAIVFVALSPDRTKGEVFLGWRGDGIQTTAGDVINQHYLMIDQHELEGRIAETRYDYHCKDLFVIAQRAGEDFLPANKKMDDGVSILNTLFKYGSLKIHLDPELEKLCKELNNLLTDTDKRNAVDDFSDALRYCVATMPWDWSKIKIEKPLRKKKPKSEIDLRRERFIDPSREVADEILDEIDEWNSLY